MAFLFPAKVTERSTEIAVKDFAELSALVGGMVEVIREKTHDGVYHVICNEEGKVFGLPRNIGATQQMSRSWRDLDFLVGPVVLLNDQEFNAIMEG